MYTTVFDAGAIRRLNPGLDASHAPPVPPGPPPCRPRRPRLPDLGEARRGAPAATHEAASVGEGAGGRCGRERARARQTDEQSDGASLCSRVCRCRVKSTCELRVSAHAPVAPFAAQRARAAAALARRRLPPRARARQRPLQRAGAVAADRGAAPPVDPRRAARARRDVVGVGGGGVAQRADERRPTLRRVAPEGDGEGGVRSVVRRERRPCGRGVGRAG